MEVDSTNEDVHWENIKPVRQNNLNQQVLLIVKQNITQYNLIIDTANEGMYNKIGLLFINENSIPTIYFMEINLNTVKSYNFDIFEPQYLIICKTNKLVIITTSRLIQTVNQNQKT